MALLLLPQRTCAASSSRLLPFTHLRQRQFTSSPSSHGRAPDSLLNIPALDKDEDHIAAREWLDEFTVDDVPKTSYVASYARSSGAGGQHVNKTNSKAVVHMDIHKAKGDWLPRFVVPALLQSSYYHAPNLLFTSQETRSAPQNLRKALENMHAAIVKSGRGLIRGQTSEEQKERVQMLKAGELVKKRFHKEKMKSKKASRRGDY